MLIDKVFGDPEIHKDAFLSRHAVVVGRVIIMQDVMVAPGAILRADECWPFYIGKGVNIQDLVILHGLAGKYVDVYGKEFSVYIDSHSSITHGAKIHGPVYIGKKCFVGFDAIVLKSKIGRNTFIDPQAYINGSTVAEYCHIGAKASILGVVIERERYVPPHMLVNTQEVADSLERVPTEIAEEDKAFNKHVIDTNKEKLRMLYKERRNMRKVERQSKKK